MGMRQPAAYAQMLKREGRFRILKSKLSKDIRIWHNCDDYGDEPLDKNRTIYEVRYETDCSYELGTPEHEAHWRCTMCGEAPPEGLTGAYIMLDWERATDEVANAGQDPFMGVAAI